MQNFIELNAAVHEL